MVKGRKEGALMKEGFFLFIILSLLLLTSPVLAQTDSKADAGSPSVLDGPVATIGSGDTSPFIRDQEIVHGTCRRFEDIKIGFEGVYQHSDGATIGPDGRRLDSGDQQTSPWRYTSSPK
jgi:hypothetical protein